MLGFKDEPFGKIIIAIECKNVEKPVGIIEVRNFKEKLDTLQIINKGVIVSKSGFTEEARNYAKRLGIELWDIHILHRKLLT